MVISFGFQWLWLNDGRVFMGIISKMAVKNKRFLRNPPNATVKIIIALFC